MHNHFLHILYSREEKFLKKKMVSTCNKNLWNFSLKIIYNKKLNIPFYLPLSCLFNRTSVLSALSSLLPFTDFREIWYKGLLTNFVKKYPNLFQISLKCRRLLILVCSLLQYINLYVKHLLIQTLSEFMTSGSKQVTTRKNFPDKNIWISCRDVLPIIYLQITHLSLFNARKIFGVCKLWSL